MKLLDPLRSYLQALFHRSQVNVDMDEEMRSHIQFRADDFERSGLSRAEAERQARIEFGGYERVKEECHQAAGGTLLESIWKDVRYAVRMLRKSPGFTLVAVGTLALTIGANAVVFSVLNAFILKPLNVPHPETLFALWRPALGSAYISYRDYLDFRERNHSFESLVAFTMSEAGLDTGNNPSPAWVYETSGNYFDALGLKPFLGRVYHAADEHGPNSAPYIVLAYSYWHTRFHDDPDIVGRILLLNKHAFTVIGVAQPGFHGTILFFSPSCFSPITNHGQFGSEDLNTRAAQWVFMTMGHLKPGVTQAAAIADLNAIGADLERSYPKDVGNMKFTLAKPSLYGDYLGRPVRAFLAGLMLLAGLILLAACANLGSLFAARAADRSREVALRLALGSTRARVLRQLFTEALLISLAGGVLGVAGSVPLLRQLSAWQPFPRFPIHLAVDPDAGVYLMALLLTLASAFLFGSVPVKQVFHTSPYEVVKSGSTSAVGRRVTLRDILLIAQIAICALLVTSSVVAVRGLLRSLHNDLGFEVDRTLIVDTDLSMAGYSGEAVEPMQKRMLDAVQAIPGVESAALADSIPLSQGLTDTTVFSDNATDLRPGNSVADADLLHISPEYFHAAGTTLLAGRSFTWHDDKDAPRVAVINQELARRLFGGVEKAVGSAFKLPNGTRLVVVGVAETGKYSSLTENPTPALFVPLLQAPSSKTYLTIRTTGDPQALAGAVRTTIQGLDAGLPFFLQTRYRTLDLALFGARMATIALGVLGVMGALLSITGIFGMAAYSVSKRLKELGIRIALGAKRKEVLAAALSRPLKLLAFGSVAGLILGVLASKILGSIVYQATPRDPLVLTGAVLCMVLLGLLATWIPARRALSVDPLRLLREE
jgi:predicted permease